jgi:hypothetical protein
MEAAISFLPIVGPIFDLSMAVVGKSLYGRQRSPLERVIIGIGVFVPLLVEVAVQGTKITARTVLLMKVNKVGSTNIKRFNKIFEAIPIAVAMRELTPEQIKEVLLLVEKLGKGVKLAQEEASRFAYLAGRLYEAGTAGHWLEIIKSKTGTAEIKGRHITDLSGVKFREGEREAGEVIARELNEQVIHLPELGPDEFQKGIKKAIREGEKHPDVLIGREFGDVKRATTSNAYAYRTNMTKGGRQGGTIIADLQGTQLRASELEKQLPGLWGSSGGRKIHRVIIVDGGKAKVFHRPQQFSPLAFTPPVNATAIELHKVWDEVQKEAQQ